jgi:hypothetical protein
MRSHAPRATASEILIERFGGKPTISARISTQRAEIIRSMKNLLPISLLTLALMVSGCAWTQRHIAWHHSPSKAKPAATTSKTIVTPDDSLAAKVLTVNTVGRFVVLNFPDGRLPKLDQHLFLYRGGLKTAEVKIVGPQQESSIVADIVSGDAQAGDTVRDQ